MLDKHNKNQICSRNM